MGERADSFTVVVHALLVGARAHVNVLSFFCAKLHACVKGRNLDFVVTHPNPPFIFYAPTTPHTTCQP
jgi:hypothetical protein